MINVYLDFEYIENKPKTYRHLICGVIKQSNETATRCFDLRISTDSLKDYLLTLDVNDTRFIAYNITTAEVPVLCQFMSREWLLSTIWIDLWTEFKMFALTHPKYFTSKTGLSGCLKSLKIEDKYEADKNSTRNLILYGSSQIKFSESNRKTRVETDEFIYSDEEYTKILKYCEQDVLILPEVVSRLNEISRRYEIRVTDRTWRGAHTMCAGLSYYYHKGYPMDVERVKKIFENIPKIKVSLQKNCNEETGFEIYKAILKGPVKRKHFSHYQFNMNNFGEYLKDKGLYSTWDKTLTGLRLEDEYLDKMISQHKDILEPIYNARNTIKQLNSTNLAEIMTPEGYIKSVSWPFNQKTSRTSPKPKLGFVMNLTPWLRMLVKPKSGRAFVGIDFKSQEVLIAACLALDESMLEDYLTDIYMGQAIKTGFAPVGATKKSHQKLRDGFKPIVLGTNFGMQADSLSIRFFNLFKLIGQDKTLEQCVNEARKFLVAHEKAYSKYYSFLKKHFKETMRKGYYQTIDNWFYFVDNSTRPTQLVNVPCQSGGAAITRLAHDNCVRQGIDVIQLHDALYFECDEDDAVTLAKIVSKEMCDASAKVLGYDHMSTETKIFTNEVPYYDPRGEQIYKFIMQELDLDCPEKFKKPKEISNIHLT